MSGASGEKARAAAAWAVRPARAGDMAAVTAIYADSVLGQASSFELVPPGEAEMQQRREAAEAAGCPYLVAEEGGEVAGFAYAAPFRQRPGYRWTAEASVYVAEGARGRGMGKALMAGVVAGCEAGGFRLLVATIVSPGNEASERMCAALGFTRAGRLEGAGWKRGRWLDVVFMQRALGAGKGAPPEGAES